MWLSIIIPIYNAGRVLGRTIDSVLNQGLASSEYEIILVNDGSIDNSLEICKAFAEKYPDIIKVLSKENEGVSKARNLGMKHALGDYLYFMDADDYLMPGGFRYLVDNYFTTAYDVIAFHSSTINNFGEDHLPIGDVKGEIVFDGYGCDFLKNSWQTFIWNQWYRKDFLIPKGIEFSDMKISEDILFNLQVWSKNPRVRIISSNIYRYINYVGTNQLTKKRDYAYLRSCIDSQMYLFSYISELNGLYKKRYNSTNMELLFQSVMRSFMSRVLSSDLSTSEFKCIIKDLKEMKLFPFEIKNNKYTKVIDFMIRNYIFFPLYKLLYKRLFIPYVLPKLSRE